MKRLITFLVLAIPVLVIGQADLTDGFDKKNYKSNDYVGSNFDESAIENYITDQKLKFNLRAGAVFGTNFGSGEHIGTYLAPQLNYRLTPKFTVRTGAVLYQSYGDINSPSLHEANTSYPSTNFSGSLLYASGAYQMNDRLILSGTVYKNLNLYNQPTNTTKNYNNEFQGMIMGVDYRLGKNIFIQGQIEISNNPYSRYTAPYSQFGNSFGNSAFDRFPPF